MFDDIQQLAQSEMQSAISSLQEALKKVRTGRAHTDMLASVKVDYYGTLTPLNQVAAVSCPDAKSFLIAPWDAGVLKAIEQGIVKSDVGMAPQSDGKQIRLKLPELDEKRRHELVRALKKTLEEARVSVRMARRKAVEKLKAMKKDGDLSEDELKTHQKTIQDLTDKFVGQIDKLGDQKEKELLTV